MAINVDLSPIFALPDNPSPTQLRGALLLIAQATVGTQEPHLPDGNYQPVPDEANRADLGTVTNRLGTAHLTAINFASGNLDVDGLADALAFKPITLGASFANTAWPYDHYDSVMGVIHHASGGGKGGFGVRSIGDGVDAGSNGADGGDSTLTISGDTATFAGGRGGDLDFGVAPLYHTNPSGTGYTIISAVPIATEAGGACAVSTTNNNTFKNHLRMRYLPSMGCGQVTVFIKAGIAKPDTITWTRGSGGSGGSGGSIGGGAGSSAEPASGYLIPFRTAA